MSKAYNSDINFDYGIIDISDTPASFL